MATRTLPSCGRPCNVVSKQSRHSRATRMDLRSQTGLILLINSFQTKFPATPQKWPPVGANEERESKCWLSEHPGCHGVALDTLRGGALRWYRSWGGSLVQFALLSTTFFEGKKKKNRPDFGKNLKITSFIKKEQKWCFLCGGWLYLTVPSKHVWFILVLQRCFSLSESGRFSFVEKEGKSVRERIGALDTQKTLVVLWSGVKSI